MELHELTVRPLLVFGIAMVVMVGSVFLGRTHLRRRYALDENVREDLGFILPSSLTLLALIVGFSFSMAAGRYDQRKNYEEAEANAIGTEYLRADLLASADAENVRRLLRDYLEQRILYYMVTDPAKVPAIDARTDQLEAEMWSALLPAARATPTPTVALVVAGMNDVINSQGYTQSAWWYRIPDEAWILMLVIAIGCNVLVGYGSRGIKGGTRLLLILPLLIAIALMLIADIDSPRHGFIRVRPKNLQSAAESIRPR